MKTLIKSLDEAIAELTMLKAPVIPIQKYFNQEVMFNHDNKTYLWQGDFSIASEIVMIEDTYSFNCLHDQSEVELTPMLEYVLRHEILNNY